MEIDESLNLLNISNMSHITAKISDSMVVDSSEESYLDTEDKFNYSYNMKTRRFESFNYDNKENYSNPAEKTIVLTPRKSLLKKHDAVKSVVGLYSTPMLLGKPKKEVSFGKKLTPELFDKTLPPNTPLQKGRRPETLTRESMIIHSESEYGSLIDESLDDKNNISNLNLVDYSTSLNDSSSKEVEVNKVSESCPTTPTNLVNYDVTTVLDSTSKITEGGNKSHDELENGVTPKTIQIKTPHFILKDNTTISIDNNNKNAPENSTFNMENNTVSNVSNKSKVQKSLASKIPKPGSLCTTPYYERIRDKKSKTDKTNLVCYSVGSNKVESLRKSSRIPKTPLTVLKTTRHAKMPGVVLENKNNSNTFTWQNSLMDQESTPNEKVNVKESFLLETTTEKTKNVTPASNHLLPWPKSIGKMQHFKTTGKFCVNNDNIDNFTPEIENVHEQQSENLPNDKLENTAFLDGKNNECPKDIIDFSSNESLKCDVDDSVKQTDKTMDSLSNLENSMGFANSSENKDLTSLEKTPRRVSARISCKTQPSTPAAISITSNKTINETPITNKTHSPNNNFDNSINCCESIQNSVLDKDTSSISNFSEKTDPHLLGKDIRIIVTSCTPHIESENENTTIEKPENIANPPTLEEISPGMDQSILNVSDGNISNVQHNKLLNNTKGQNNETIIENKDTIANISLLNTSNKINTGNNMDDFETKPQKTMGEKKYTKAELAEINRKIDYVNHWVIAFSHYTLAKNKILASCKNKNRKNHLQRKSKIKAKATLLNTSTMRSAKRSLKRTLRNVNKKTEAKTILINARNTKKINAARRHGKIKPIRNIISKRNPVLERNSFLREGKLTTTSHKTNDIVGVSPKLNASIKQKTMDEKNSISLHNSINPKSMKSAKIIKPSNAKVLKRQPLYKLLKHGGRNQKNLPPKPILSSTRKCARKLVKRIATTNTTVKKPKHTIFLSSMKNSQAGKSDPEMMNNSKSENRRSTRLSSIRIEKNDLLSESTVPKGIASPIRLEKSNMFPSNDNVLSNDTFSNEKATLELFGTPKTYQKGLKMARNSNLISSLRSTLVDSPSSASFDLINSKMLRTKSDIYVQKSKNQTLPLTGEDHKKFRSTFHNIPPMLMNDENSLSIPHPLVPPQIENVDMAPPQKLMNFNNITSFEGSPVIQQNDILSENVTNNPNNDDEIEQFRHSQDCTDPVFNYAKSNHSNNTYRVSDPLFTETTFVKEKTDSLGKSFSSQLSSTNTQTRSYSLYGKQPFKSSENAPNTIGTRVSLQSGPPPHQPNTPITSSKNSVQLHGKRVETRRIPGLNKLFNTNLGICNFNDDTKNCNYNAGDSSESSLVDNCQLKSAKAGKKFAHLTADLFESSTFKKSSRGSACLALMEARRMKNAAAMGLESAKNHIANGKRKNRSTPPQIVDDVNKDQNSAESSILINENGQNLTYVIAGEPRTEKLTLENDNELFNEVTGKNIVASKVKSPYKGKKAIKASDLNAPSPASIEKNSKMKRENLMINNSESEMKSQTADTDASPKVETLKKRTKKGGLKSKLNRKLANKKPKSSSKAITGKEENEALNSGKIPANNIVEPLNNDMASVAKEFQNKNPPAKIKSTKRSTRNHPNKSISDNTEQPADILEEKNLEVPPITTGKRVDKSRFVRASKKSNVDHPNKIQPTSPISNILDETNNQNVQILNVPALMKSRSRSKSTHPKMIKPQQEKQENIVSPTMNDAVIMPTSPKQPSPLMRSKRKAETTIQKNGNSVDQSVQEITSETQGMENIANTKSKRAVKRPTKTEEAPIINVPDIIEPPKPKRTRQTKQPKVMGDTKIEQSNLTEMINQSGKPKNAIEEIPMSANKKRRNKHVAFDLDNIQQLIISRANSIEPTTCLTAISIPKTTLKNKKIPKKANNTKRLKQGNNRESETIPASINGEESSKVVENLGTNVEMSTRKRKSIPTAKMLSNELLLTIQPDNTQVSENIKPISNKRSKRKMVEAENITHPVQLEAPPLKSVKTAKNVTLKTTKSSTDSRKPQRSGPVKNKTNSLPNSKVVIEETQPIAKRVTRSQKRI